MYQQANWLLERSPHDFVQDKRMVVLDGVRVCGYTAGSGMDASIDYVCGRPPEDHVKKTEPADRAHLGEITTRDLLQELRLRGDFALTAMPTSARGEDGAVLSAVAGSVLRSCSKETLEAKRGE